MENLDIAEESTNEIYIDVEENNKEVEPSKEKAGESVSQSLASSLDKELGALINVHGHFGFIYKVSEKYRKVKEECYTPRVVSIGPLHHGKSHLQAMEGYKLSCLNKLINETAISLKELSEFATNNEGLVRACYQGFKAKEFSKMILLDGIFIIVLIADTTTLFTNSWLASDVKHDMLLLENQLPFFFIAGLSSLLHTKDDKYSINSHDLFNYFKDVGITSRLEKNLTAREDALHLVDFLLDLHVLSSTKSVQSHNKRFQNTRSASELQEAGVRFGDRMGDLFEVSFECGRLKLPQLTVNDKTETFFRNLIAYEECGHYEKHITSYVIFMNTLINTAEDVKLLQDNKIIVNLLGEDQLVADLFNNLHKEVIEDGREFYFAQICTDLNEYSKDCFHQWKSSWFKWKLVLKDRYFSNPWSVISFIAANIVVVLTIVQTGYAIIGYEK